jgi:hypothetical protein
MQDKDTYPDRDSMAAPGIMEYDGLHKLRLISIDLAASTAILAPEWPFQLISRTISELAVIVLPLTAWCDFLGGVPMLYHFALCESKEVIEGGMVTVVVALANAKHKVSLGENTMDAVIVDAPAALILGFQCGSENRHAISSSRVVLGVGVFINKIAKPIKLSIDEHHFDERLNQRTVALRQFKVNGLGRPIHHDAARSVWIMSFLDIVSVLHGLSVFEFEDFEANFAAREIVLCMRKDEIVIFIGAHDIHPGRGHREPLEKVRQPLAALVSLGVVLNVFRFIDDGDRPGITSLDTF